LTRRAATANANSDIELPIQLRSLDRLFDSLLMGGARKVILERAGVHRPLTLTGREHDAGDGTLSPAHRLNLLRFFHRPLFGSYSDVEVLRLLAVVRMIRPGVYLQFLSYMLSQRILGKHPPDGKLDHTIRIPFDHSSKGDMLLVAHIAGVPKVRFLFRFAPRQRHFFRVDHDNVIADIKVRREHGLVLATKNPGNARGETTQGFSLGVDEPPTALNVVGFWSVSFHMLPVR
jgi:hypothetical protein